MAFFVKIILILIHNACNSSLPLFHRFNSQYFENSLTVNNQPLVKVRWSDNRLKTTAGFYKRKRINGF